MKKAALTFGLFSLVMVATSFANPEKTNRSIAGNIDIIIGTDGSGNQTGDQGRKKHDLLMPNQSNFNYNSKSSSVDIQSIGTSKKID